MWPVLFTSLSIGAPVAPVLSAAGGYDVSMSQPWVGLDFAVHSSQQKGFAPLGRITPSWGFTDSMPFVPVELGFSGVLPNKEATIRLGAVARTNLLFGKYRMPIRLGDPTSGKVVAGLQIGGEALVEFEWRPEAPITLGIRAGVAPTVADYACDAEDPDLTTCLLWNAGFIGGFNFRKRWKNGFSIDAMGGFTSHLAIGYAF